jgi:uncharacterized protein (TIGR02145 family)
MAENLNTGAMISAGQEQNNHGSIEKYCYENTESNCAVYGGLYQWDNMMQWSTEPGAQGICPSGWHIPTMGDWSALEDFLGGSSVAGGKMKETGFEHWISPNTGATNESGFTALPGGGWYFDGAVFLGLTIRTAYWSSSEYSSANAGLKTISYYSESFQNSGNNEKSYGYSLRCIMD